jgi:hypothetical protein
MSVKLEKLRLVGSAPGRSSRVSSILPIRRRCAGPPRSSSRPRPGRSRSRSRNPCKRVAIFFICLQPFFHLTFAVRHLGDRHRAAYHPFTDLLFHALNPLKSLTAKLVSLPSVQNVIGYWVGINKAIMK